MKRLHCIVEGQTEVAVFTAILSPYIYQKTGAYCLFTAIKHTGGGIVQFSKIFPELRKHLQEKKIVTTFFDYYGIHKNHQFKNFQEAKINQHNAQFGVDLLEKGMTQYLEDYNVNTRYFIPYIQLHEFEAILFSSPESFYDVYDNQEIVNYIQNIRNRYPNPEAINDSPQTAPSKRIIKIVEKHNNTYEKVIDGQDIAELAGIEVILENCPRFRQWVNQLIEALNDL